MFLHPLDEVLVSLLDESDALEDVCDVVDATLLLHVQGVGSLEKRKMLNIFCG